MHPGRRCGEPPFRDKYRQRLRSVCVCCVHFMFIPTSYQYQQHKYYTRLWIDISLWHEYLMPIEIFRKIANEVS